MPTNSTANHPLLRICGASDHFTKSDYEVPLQYAVREDIYAFSFHKGGYCSYHLGGYVRLRGFLVLRAHSYTYERNYDKSLLQIV